jgi:hypothetical protein
LRNLEQKVDILGVTETAAENDRKFADERVTNGPRIENVNHRLDGPQRLIW